ncbi:putative cellulase [Tieghemostelium lacteum]|uniref:Endoglucanase n=1 Tax=Tieghemostelium lacteum TaxID=361077 RepID=A0A152A3P7_TIELA|nr:putative cellulase [Tieghemostelium lacteum]|eukprot:KYR00846.1 putative cellulase [Tieghemostelium lacteum]
MIIKYLLVFVALVTIVLADSCYNSIDWRSANGKLTGSGNELQLQGIAWFGLETTTYSPGGLQTTSVEALLDILVQTKFNVIRIPFSVDMILNNRFPTSINYALNPNLQGKNALDVIEYITQKAAERGILIVLEQHRFHPADYIPPLWYDSSYPETTIISSWITLVNRFKKYWNLWGLDIKNEPHDPATWGTGDLSTDWDKAFARISNSIANATAFNGVYLLEGIQGNPICSSPENNWWGGNMEPLKCFPVNLNQADRIVFAPHTFCSSVFDQPYFNAGNYPANMNQIWENQFGFLTSKYFAVAIGEWGCKVNSTKNQNWLNSFVAYLNNKGIRNHLFFALNPDSADTDSPINADWKTINQNTINYIKLISPSPTKFYQAGTQICIANGISTSSSTSGLSTTSSTSSTTGSSTTSTTGSSTSSTTGSSTTSTTGSSTTSTTSSTSSTTGSSTTSTTGPQTSTTSTGSTSGSTTTTSTNSLVITQTLSSSWKDGSGNSWVSYNCQITNTGSTIIYQPEWRSNPNQKPSSTFEIWGLTASNDPLIAWSLTWSNNIAPGQSYSFGYNIKLNSAIVWTRI